MLTAVCIAHPDGSLTAEDTLTLPLPPPPSFKSSSVTARHRTCQEVVVTQRPQQMNGNLEVDAFPVHIIGPSEAVMSQQMFTCTRLEKRNQRKQPASSGAVSPPASVTYEGSPPSGAF